MPKITHLTNNDVQIRYGVDREEKGDGTVEEHRTWTIVYKDRVYGDELHCKLRVQGRDAVIADLQKQQASAVVVAQQVPGGLEEL